MFSHEDEKKLGPAAELGISFYLLDEKGKVIAKDGYRQNDFFPMASIFKIVVALKILYLIHLNKLSLDSKIPIKPADFSPGLPTNTLDRYFFLPFPIWQEKTIDELLTLMLTKSDNTATDKLLFEAGGIDAVNDFAKKELGLNDYHLNRTCKQLLSYYYELPEDSYFYPIRMLYELKTAFLMRPTEKSLITSQEDSCKPETMTTLMQTLIASLQKNNWLSLATKDLFERMKHCETGPGMIKAGASEYLSKLDLGHKTGGLGAIRCDTGFMHFKNEINNKWIVLSIMTAHSSVPLAQREEVIAKVTRDLMNKHVHHFNLDHSKKLTTEKTHQRVIV